MVRARKIVLASAFQGVPRPQDFRVEEEDLPALRDGQILVEAVYLSVDPFQRSMTEMQRVGNTFFGAQVGRIVESRAADFPVGRQVVGYWGWRDRTVADVGPGAPDLLAPPMLVPGDLAAAGLPVSLCLGTLGMPGLTAYFPLLEVCQPKPGEVVVVSGAAGAVGSVAGQIALIRGCTVIGFAGSDDKVEWLKNELGFHHAFNYKTTDVDAALERAAPDGVDVYFDNVSGDLSTAVMRHMRYRGRVAVVGGVSQYNERQPGKLTTLPFSFLAQQLRLQATTWRNWLHRWDEGVGQLTQWVREGRLRYRETVTKGFLSAPDAFIGMLRGDNFGKAVVEV